MMTPSDSYYTSFIVDKIYDLVSKGDKRNFGQIEASLWADRVDSDFKLIQELEAFKKEALEIIKESVSTSVEYISYYEDHAREFLKKHEGEK